MLDAHNTILNPTRIHDGPTPQIVETGVLDANSIIRDPRTVFRADREPRTVLAGPWTLCSANPDATDFPELMLRTQEMTQSQHRGHPGAERTRTDVSMCPEVILTMGNPVELTMVVTTMMGVHKG